MSEIPLAPTIAIGILKGANDLNNTSAAKSADYINSMQALQLQKQAAELNQKRFEEEKRANIEAQASGKPIPQKKTESVPLPPDSGSARNTLMEIARPQGSGVSEKKVGNFPTSKPTQPDKDKPRAPIIPSTNQIQRPSPQPPAPRPTAPSR